jgi:hypothetical protein
MLHHHSNMGKEFFQNVSIPAVMLDIGAEMLSSRKVLL